MKISPRRTLVAIVVPPNAQSLDVSGPMDALLEANRLSDEGAYYEISLIATSLDKMVRLGGMSLLAEVSIYDDDRIIDTLLVAGSSDYALADENKDLRNWLQRRAPLTRRRGSVGTGAFFLGAAGLLNGMSATTHWQHTSELAQRYPLAKILPDHIYVEDQALYTSAGVTAGIDLALKLIEGDHGRELARKVAHRLVASLNRGGQQAQFSNRLVSHSANCSRIQAVQNWILNHLALDLTLESLAGRAGIGVRHFTRTFRSETGITPADFVEIARVDAARKMIESSDMSLQDVASRCGFVNQDVMRRAFIRKIGYRPGLHRTKAREEISYPRRSVKSAMNANY